jgi:uncharacterized cupredoxin-like copper-binding protein
MRAGVALVVAGLLVGACGGGDSGTSSGTASSSSGASAPASTPATTVTAVETEFSIVLSPDRLRPGAYLFKVQNKGQFPHNLTIEGPGVDSVASPTLQSGQSGELRVTLQNGRYELWCSVDAHKDKGMDITVQVGQSAAPTMKDDDGY